MNNLALIFSIFPTSISFLYFHDKQIDSLLFSKFIIMIITSSYWSLNQKEHSNFSIIRFVLWHFHPKNKDHKLAYFNMLLPIHMIVNLNKHEVLLFVVFECVDGLLWSIMHDISFESSFCFQSIYFHLPSLLLHFHNHSIIKILFYPKGSFLIITHDNFPLTILVPLVLVLKLRFFSWIWVELCQNEKKFSFASIFFLLSFPFIQFILSQSPLNISHFILLLSILEPL